MDSWSAWTPENFLHKTDTFANAVRMIVSDNYRLRLDKDKSTGEVKEAYDLIIKSNVWKIHKLIGEYWRETNLLALSEAGPNGILSG